MAHKEYGTRRYTTTEAVNVELGQLGFDFVDGTAPQTGNWVGIKAVNGTAEIDVASTSAGDDVTTNIILQDGDVIYAPFTAFTLANATDQVIAYRG